MAFKAVLVLALALFVVAEGRYAFRRKGGGGPASSSDEEGGSGDDSSLEDIVSYFCGYLLPDSGMGRRSDDMDGFYDAFWNCETEVMDGLGMMSDPPSELYDLMGSPDSSSDYLMGSPDSSLDYLMGSPDSSLDFYDPMAGSPSGMPPYDPMAGSSSDMPPWEAFNYLKRKAALKKPAPGPGAGPNKRNQQKPAPPAGGFKDAPSKDRRTMALLRNLLRRNNRK